MGALFDSGQVVELRCLGTKRGTVSGYFDDLTKLWAAAKSLDGTGVGVYATLNPVNPALLARAENRPVSYAKSTTSDTDILCRRWLPIDLDPVRPAGISSTDTEHEAALVRAGEIRTWLAEQGWPEPILADSGNGAHLLYRIDLPNDAESTKLVGDCLQAIALRFSDAVVDVDVTTKNPARIWKLYGTTACKWDSTPDRPHRKAQILETPDPLEVVPAELLVQLAGSLPEKPISIPSNVFLVVV